MVKLFDIFLNVEVLHHLMTRVYQCDLNFCDLKLANATSLYCADATTTKKTKRHGKNNKKKTKTF